MAGSASHEQQAGQRQQEGKKPQTMEASGRRQKNGPSDGKEERRFMNLSTGLQQQGLDLVQLLRLNASNPSAHTGNGCNNF